MKHFTLFLLLLVNCQVWSQTIVPYSEFIGIILKKGKKTTPIAIGETLTIATNNQSYYGKLENVSSEQLSISGNTIAINQITFIEYMSTNRIEKQKKFQMSGFAGLGVAITSVVLAVNSKNDDLSTAFGILATFSFIYAPIGTIIGYRLRDPKKMVIKRGWEILVSE